MIGQRLLVLVTVVAITACGEKKPATSEDVPAKPAAASVWYEADAPCPAGSVLMRRDAPRPSVYCERDKVRHGRYSTLHPNGSILVMGHFTDGLRDGEWTQFDAAGKKLGSYTLTGGSGTVTEWLADGSLALQFTVEAGARNGKWIKYYNPTALGPERADRSVRQERGQYVTDQRHGTWTFWDAAGRVTREVDYDSGRVIETRHFENGALARTEEGDPNPKLAGADQQVAKLSSLSKPQISALMSDELKNTAARLGSGGGMRIGAGKAPKNSKARLSLGQVTTVGGLDKAVTSRVVRRRIKVFRYCYERQLQRAPEIGGKMVVRFSITSEGRVLAPKARGVDEKVEDCIERQVMRLRFPKPSGGGMVRVTMPLVMKKL